MNSIHQLQQKREEEVAARNTIEMQPPININNPMIRLAVNEMATLLGFVAMRELVTKEIKEEINRVLENYKKAVQQ